MHRPARRQQHGCNVPAYNMKLFTSTQQAQITLLSEGRRRAMHCHEAPLWLKHAVCAPTCDSVPEGGARAAAGGGDLGGQARARLLPVARGQGQGGRRAAGAQAQGGISHLLSMGEMWSLPAAGGEPISGMQDNAVGGALSLRSADIRLKVWLTAPPGSRCSGTVVDWQRANVLGLLQRQEKDGPAPGPAGGSAAAAHGGEGGEEAKILKEPKLLRTYAQKKAKADPVSEQAPMLDPGVLALVAGKNRRRTA